MRRASSEVRWNRGYGAVVAAAERLKTLLKRQPVLGALVKRLIRAVAAESPSAPKVLRASRSFLRGRMSAGDVERVLSVLDQHNLRFWVSGGWGIDALVGRQTRNHDDLDIIIDDFEAFEPTARRALGELGFRFVDMHKADVWMPKYTSLSDDSGHRVELMSLDWDLLARAFGSPVGSSHRALELRVFSEGKVGSRTPVPCLSANTQLLFHSGFACAQGQLLDVDLLKRELVTELPESAALVAEQYGRRHSDDRDRGESALIIPVRAADSLVGPLRKRYDPWFESGMPLHITVLMPFVPPDVLSDPSIMDELRKLFGRMPAFAFTLARIGSFEHRLVYLAPEPPGSFVAMTDAVYSRFPDHPPYLGAHDEVVPHVTVGVVPKGAQARVRRRLGAALPIRASADEVWLMRTGPTGVWIRERTFILGRCQRDIA